MSKGGTINREITFSLLECFGLQFTNAFCSTQNRKGDGGLRGNNLGLITNINKDLSDFNFEYGPSYPCMNYDTSN